MPVKFDRQHYNALAKIMRENFPDEDADDVSYRHGRTQHVFICMKMANYFKSTDQGFDPIKFLDACSPDVDVYPLSELWEV